MASTQLNYTCATNGFRSTIRTVQVELGPDFNGKFIGISRRTMLDLKFGVDVTVHYDGRRYRFGQLNQDGSFELRPDGWSY